MIGRKRTKVLKLLKRCGGCKRNLPYSLFSKNKTGKGGYHSLCKECQASRAYLRLYGITIEQAKRLLEKQGGVCALCDETLEIPSKVAHVDHCHRSGKVRGILCRQCNTALGKLGDSEESLKKTIIYLRGGLYENG